MLDNKVILTYKRKRFSSQSNSTTDCKTDLALNSPREISPRGSNPRVEPDTYEEKPDKENPGGWQYVARNERCNFEEPHQQRVREMTKTRKTKITDKSELGPMKLRSHRVLLSPRSVEDGSRKAISSIIDSSVNKIKDSVQIGNSDINPASACKVTCLEGSSMSQLTDLEKGRSGSICLDSSTERRCSSGFPEDSVTVNSDRGNALLFRNGCPKDNSSTPLLTFCRRVKKKQEVGETFVQGTSNEAKQCSSHELKASCKCEVSCRKCNFMDQPTSSAVLQEHAECSPSNVPQQDVGNVREDNGLESAPVGGSLEATIPGDMGEDSLCQYSYISHKTLDHLCPLPCQPAEHASELLSHKFVAEPVTDAIRDSVLVNENKQPDSVNAGSYIGGETGNKLVNAASNSEITISPDNISEKVCPSGLELSVALPSSLMESQGSSTRSCAIVLADEPTDGRGKELEWLETLDKELQAKKDRNTCSSIGQCGSDCRGVLNGKAFPTSPIELSVQSRSDQDASGEFTNQMTPPQERAFMTKPGDRDYEKHQYEETRNKLSRFTDFLGLSLPLYSEGHGENVKDFRNMPLLSNVSLKDTAHESNRLLRCCAIDENASVARYKQLAENIMTGYHIFKEKESTSLEKSKRNRKEWSEEELDFLWIGVRRHGVNNWNAMLRDPKLCFSKSRVAEDLAERWDIEQRKLLNVALFQPAKLSRPDFSLPPVLENVWSRKLAASNQNGGNGPWSHAVSEFPARTAETRLTLGDVYLQNENISKRNMLLSPLGTVSLLGSENPSTGSFFSSLPLGASYQNPGFEQQKAFRTQSTRYDCESSTLGQKPMERINSEHQPLSQPANSCLPHWLKEVVGMPPRTSGFVSPSGVSAIPHSASSLNIDQQARALPNPCVSPAPRKESRGRGILKRKRMASGSTTRMSDKSTSMNERWMGSQYGLLPSLGVTSQNHAPGNTLSGQSNGIDLNKKSSGPIGPSNLVVIDSDASSEETISDDQGGRQ